MQRFSFRLAFVSQTARLHSSIALHIASHSSSFFTSAMRLVSLEVKILIPSRQFRYCHPNKKAKRTYHSIKKSYRVLLKILKVHLINYIAEFYSSLPGHSGIKHWSCFSTTSSWIGFTLVLFFRKNFFRALVANFVPCVLQPLLLEHLDHSDHSPHVSQDPTYKIICFP